MKRDRDKKRERGRKRGGTEKSGELWQVPQPVNQWTKGPVGSALGGSTAGQGNKGGVGKRHGWRALLCQQAVTLLFSCLEHKFKKNRFCISLTVG